jgi:hypothetical protein
MSWKTCPKCYLTSFAAFKSVFKSFFSQKDAKKLTFGVYLSTQYPVYLSTQRGWEIEIKPMGKPEISFTSSELNVFCTFCTTCK